jgi:hypothetical protein
MLPGNSYIVGEHGPEIVSQGGSGGFVSQLPDAANTPVNITVNNVNNAPGVEVDSNVRQIDDRNFIIDVMVEQNSNTDSRPMKALRANSNVQARGGYG